MLDSRSFLGGGEVLARRREEVHHRLVLPYRSVRDVDDDDGAGQRVAQALAGDGVDAGGRRCSDDLMPRDAKLGNGLLADETATADDHDFHDELLSTLLPSAGRPWLNEVCHAPARSRGTSIPF